MVQKNLELAPQELKPQRIGDELSLAAAITSPPIWACTVDELSKALRLVMVKIGLRSQNWPADEEKVVLLNHIIKHFGGNRLDEINLAFDMAMAGKLEVNINCYENFSCVYFSSIMYAYRRWAADAYKSLPEDKPIEQKIFTQSEIEDGQREDVERQYQLFIRGHAIKNTGANKPILLKDNLLSNGESVVEFFSRRMDGGFKHIYERV